jgi:hypothetical protein
MIRDADGGRDRYGRLAYIWAIRNLRVEPFEARIGERGPLVRGPAAASSSATWALRRARAFERVAEDGARLGVRAEPRAMGANGHANDVGSASRSIVRATSQEDRRQFDRRSCTARRRRAQEVKRLKIKVKPGALTVEIPEESA